MLRRLSLASVLAVVASFVLDLPPTRNLNRLAGSRPSHSPLGRMTSLTNNSNEDDPPIATEQRKHVGGQHAVVSNPYGKKSPRVEDHQSQQRPPDIQHISHVKQHAVANNPYHKKSPRTDKVPSQAMSPEFPFAKRAKPAGQGGSLPGNCSIAYDDILETTLQKVFGYSSFRPGQKEVIVKLLQGVDCAVFWPTGQGKSILYQIPALIQDNDKMVLVVSPLISLMQDQVYKLNGLLSEPGVEPVATFLGSAQTDGSMEQRVFASSSTTRLVYLTPEKLDQIDFVRRLEAMAHRIVVIAIDEAHCVSEWGHDFRESYQRIGQHLRNSSIAPSLSSVPLLALTATATQRVQEDLLSSLKMQKGCFVHKQSLDRSNLELTVRSRAGGIPSAMKELAAELRNMSEDTCSHNSTIVYASTRQQVEDIAQFLKQNVAERKTKQGSPLVAAYHAGMSHGARQDAHTTFLTGQTPVIVSTVAFGMGIDKPDTRRVIHYGPPKTMEEYYQQIGRAGRDGLHAQCIMFCEPTDFDRYKSDFYLGNLNGKAKEVVVDSMNALRKYSLSSEACRRKTLLQYFGETPMFGKRCGTCDVCQKTKLYANDLTRDFSEIGARTLLLAVDALHEQGATNILKVVAGGLVERSRYKGSKSPVMVQQEVERSKNSHPHKYPQDFFRELINLLVQEGYLCESTKSAQVSGFSKAWTVYSLSAAGKRSLADGGPIILPVPMWLREREQQEREKREKLLIRLESSAVSRDKIPVSEILAGGGEVINAYSKWHNYLDSMRKAGKEDRVSNLEHLLKMIETWRSTSAVQSRMAPASVLAEHLLVSIAYTQATMPPGIKFDYHSLWSAGVRSRDINGLVKQLGEWVEKYQPGDASRKDALEIVFDGTGVQPSSKWYYAVYKPNKKTGLATWESSYNRFMNGESPEAIAMSQNSGKQPIQAKTVVGHILDAFVHGRTVELHRLAPYMSPPNKQEWAQLHAAEVAMGMDITRDPATSGWNGDVFKMTDLLRPVVGDEVVDTPGKDRTSADQEMIAQWYDKVKWYMALRRVDHTPKFHSEI